MDHEAKASTRAVEGEDAQAALAALAALAAAKALTMAARHGRARCVWLLTTRADDSRLALAGVEARESALLGISKNQWGQAEPAEKMGAKGPREGL